MRRGTRFLSRGIALASLAATVAAISAAPDGIPKIPAYSDHAKLVSVRDGTGKERAVESIADWAVRRAHILGHVQEVMGELPGAERRVPLDVQTALTVEEPAFTRRKITYASEPGDRVPAWVFVPKGLKSAAPAMLCLHQTTRFGKDEPAGLGGLPNLRYARELAERGYVTLVPDYPNFGERRLDVYALGYASASMKGVWDHMRGVDVLQSMKEVDPDRIGAIGHSLGGHNAVFVAIFDDRIKAVVSSCGYNAFTHYFGGDIAGWSHKGYMPRLRSRYQLDLKRVPFDWPELIGALAPRAFFSNSPLGDSNFEPAGVRVCEEGAKPIYRLFDEPNRLEVVYPDAEHDFPRPIRDQAYRFLDNMLKVSHR